MSECDVRIRELEVKDYDRVRDMITSGLREALPPIMKAQLVDKAAIWGIMLGLVPVVGFTTSIDLMSLATVSFLTVFIFYVSGLLYLNFYFLPRTMEDFHSGSPIDLYEKFWVAEVGSSARREIVGSVALERVNDSNDYKLKLKRMSVDKKYRRSGTASLLLRKVLNYASEKAAKEVFLVTSSTQIPGIRLYSKFGFRTKRIFKGRFMLWMLHITFVEMSHTHR